MDFEAFIAQSFVPESSAIPPALEHAFSLHWSDQYTPEAYISHQFLYG
jgi:hypothetical protein